MRVALHDADRGHYPNLALMKLSAWHKAQGDVVERYIPLGVYDRVYSSKVFSWGAKNVYLPRDAVLGGTGYGFYDKNLPDAIEHVMPDYSLYPGFRASLGFTTRGCIRSCAWCVVPKKEGKIRAHAEIAEFLRKDSSVVVLMDNNILAHEHGIAQLEYAIRSNLRLDCNQGLDARLIAANPDLARLLARVLWMRYIRLACDSSGQMEAVEKAVRMIRKAKGGGQFFCYVLVEKIPDALERVEFLRRLKVTPFAQPYRDPENRGEVGREQRDFARWVNRRQLFNSCAWREYKGRKHADR